MVTNVGRSVFLWGQPPSQSPSVPQFTETSYMRAHSMENYNQILHGDQTRCEANFYTFDHEC